MASAADGSKIAQGQIHWGELIAAKSPFAGGCTGRIARFPGRWLVRRKPNGAAAARLFAWPIARTEARLTKFGGGPEGNAETALERCAAWRAVIAGSRPLHPRDCGEDNPGGEARIELGRFWKVGLAMPKRHSVWRQKAVLKLLPEPVEGDPEPVGKAKARTISAALTTLAAAGWEKAVKSAQPDGASVDVLYARAWSLAPSLREAMNALSQITSRGRAIRMPKLTRYCALRGPG